MRGTSRRLISSGSPFERQIGYSRELVDGEWVFVSGTTIMKTVHVRIEGRVQGVGYRAWTHRVAAGLDLSGWVRNRFDGSVEAIFQGPSEAVGVMLDRCAVGPSGALVTNVEVVGEGVGVFEGFDVRPTA